MMSAARTHAWICMPCACMVPNQVAGILQFKCALRKCARSVHLLGGGHKGVFLRLDCHTPLQHPAVFGKGCLLAPCWGCFSALRCQTCCCTPHELCCDEQGSVTAGHMPPDCQEGVRFAGCSRSGNASSTSSVNSSSGVSGGAW